MSVVVIALNGELKSPEKIKGVLEFLLDKSPAYIIGVDGGCLHLETLGLEPNRMVGDFDSTNDLERLRQKWPLALFEKYPSEKDYTDAELAIEYALKELPNQIIFIGGFGGRVDHFLGNVMLMRKVPKEIEVLAIDSENWMKWVHAPINIFFDKNDACYKYFSLIPLTSSFEGITLKGFKYPLDNATIALGESIGISNEVLLEKAQVIILSGEGVIVRSND